jgi:hypothetical protein
MRRGRTETVQPQAAAICAGPPMDPPNVLSSNDFERHAMTGAVPAGRPSAVALGGADRASVANGHRRS